MIKTILPAADAGPGAIRRQLLIINSYPASGRGWDGVADLLEPRFPVLLHRRFPRWFGYQSDWRLELLVDQTAQFVLEHLDRPLLIGHGTGAHIAELVAARVAVAGVFSLVPPQPPSRWLLRGTAEGARLLRRCLALPLVRGRVVRWYGKNFDGAIEPEAEDAAQADRQSFRAASRSFRGFSELLERGATMVRELQRHPAPESPDYPVWRVVPVPGDPAAMLRIEGDTNLATILLPGASQFPHLLEPSRVAGLIHLFTQFLSMGGTR